MLLAFGLAHSRQSVKYELKSVSGREDFKGCSQPMISQNKMPRKRLKVWMSKLIRSKMRKDLNSRSALKE